MKEYGQSLGTLKKNAPTTLSHGPHSTQQSSKGQMPVGVRRRQGRTNSAHPDSSMTSRFDSYGAQVPAAKGHGASVGTHVSAPTSVGGAAESPSVPLLYHGGEDYSKHVDGKGVTRRKIVGKV